MHIESHRHWIAVPLVLTVALLLIGIDALSAARLPSDVPDGRVLTGTFREPEIEGILSENARAMIVHDRTVLLQEGELIARAEPVGRVRIGDLHVLFFLGSAGVIAQTGGVDIVALDTPVLLSQEHGSMMLPAGMQVRIGNDDASFPSPRRVPALWKNAALKRLSSLDASSASPGFTREEIDALFARAGEESSPAASEILAITLGAKVYAPEDGERVLAPLVRSARHPLTLAVALASSLLTADRPPHNETLSLLHELSLGGASLDVQGAVRDLLPLLEALHTRIDDRFPLSQKRMREQYADFLAFLEPLLIATGDEELHRTLLTAQGRIAPQARSETVRSDIDDAALHEPDSVLSAARRLLREHGFLLSVRTETVFRAPRYAEVRGVFLSTAHGDRELSFLLDPVEGTAKSIVIDGVKQPNAVPLAALASSLAH